MSKTLGGRHTYLRREREKEEVRKRHKRKSKGREKLD